MPRPKRNASKATKGPTPRQRSRSPLPPVRERARSPPVLQLPPPMSDSSDVDDQVGYFPDGTAPAPVAGQPIPATQGPSSPQTRAFQELSSNQDRRLSVMEDNLAKLGQQFETFLFGVRQPTAAPVAGAPTFMNAGSPPPMTSAAPALSVPQAVGLLPTHATAAPALPPHAAPALPPHAPPAPPADPMLGAIIGGAASAGENDVMSRFFNLGTFLEPSLRLAIQERKYVNFGLLMADPSPNSALQVKWTNDKPAFSLAPPKLRQPYSFAEWLPLFSTYSSVLSEAHPSEAPALFTYMIRIQELSAESGTLWREYDDQFRRLKAQQASLPWQDISPRLLNTLRSKPVRPNGNHPFRQSSGGNQPQTCHSYNQKGACPNSKQCKYSHICSFCRIPGHPLFKCRKAPPTSSSKSKNP